MKLFELADGFVDLAIMAKGLHEIDYKAKNNLLLSSLEIESKMKELEVGKELFEDNDFDAVGLYLAEKLKQIIRG